VEPPGVCDQSESEMEETLKRKNSLISIESFAEKRGRGRGNMRWCRGKGGLKRRKLLRTRTLVREKREGNSTQLPIQNTIRRDRPAKKDV